MEIKKGDRLILKTRGMRIPAEAVSDALDGTVQIKSKGTISTAAVSEVELADADQILAAGVQSKLDRMTPPCPICGGPGRCLTPKGVVTVRPVLIANFECKNGHRWPMEFPQR